MGLQEAALVDLGRLLLDAGYSFSTVTPETHRRVNERARTQGREVAGSLRDVFGWNRAFESKLLSRPMFELARSAGIIEESAQLLRSRVRFATLGNEIFVHSSYPTIDPNAVFFGPDTYRFCRLIATTLRDEGRIFDRVVDVGCGSGAGGLVAAKHARRVVLADVNAEALAFARVNARLYGMPERQIETRESDVLAGVDDGAIDLVVANPPFLTDPLSRAYRNGGGTFGEDLSVRIAREARDRLTPGGQLILYTGAAIMDGVDTLLEALCRALAESPRDEWSYQEIDPDIFGEEIEQNEAYASVERIAAVALTLTKIG